MGERSGSAMSTARKDDDVEIVDYIPPDVDDPTKESPWDMVKFALCPNFTWINMTILISFINIFVLFGEVALCPVIPSRFMAVQAKCLVMHGAAYAYTLKKWLHFHRILIATVMHNGFEHLAMNLLCQIPNGLLIEPHFGWWKFLIMYFGSAVTGNLFGQIIKDKVIVGASTAIYGLFGATIALLFNRTLTLSKTPLIKIRLLFIAGTTTVTFLDQIFNKYFSKPSSSVDVEGHLGGALGGFLLTLFLVPAPKMESISIFSNTLRTTGLVLYLVLLLGELTLFFGYRQPVDIFSYFG